MRMCICQNHYSKLHISMSYKTTYFFIFVRVKQFYKILLLIFLTTFASCKKYENGPAISLMSKKARLANIWKVDTYYLNGEDKTEEYRGLVTREKLIIFQSGEFDYSELSTWVWAAEYTGKWKFINDKEELELVPDNPSIKTKTYKILRLKNKSLWLEERVSDDSLVEYHFLPHTDE